MKETKKTEPTIPFVLRYDSAENKIFSAVNESAKVEKIPFYLLEGILTNILHQVREQASAERENATRLYEKQMEEHNIECNKKCEGEAEK